MLRVLYVTTFCCFISRGGNHDAIEAWITLPLLRQLGKDIRFGLLTDGALMSRDVRMLGYAELLG